MFQSFYDIFFNNMTTIANTIIAAMSGQLSGPIKSAAIIYIVAYGFAILKGSVQEPLMDFALSAIKISVIITLVTSAGDYSQWVGKVITNDIPTFTETITGGSSNIPADAVFKNADTVKIDVQKNTGSGVLGGLISYFNGLVVMLFGGALAAIVFAYSIGITVALFALAAIGPLFIAFALFEFSRGWFFSWLGQIVNFAVLKILLTIVSTILITFLGEYLKSKAILDVISGLFFFIALCIASSFMFFILPSIASGLTGGAGYTTGVAQRFAEKRLGLLSNKGGGGSDGDKRGSANRT